MTSLPVVAPNLANPAAEPRRGRSAAKTRWIHAARFLVVIALLALLPSPHRRETTYAASDQLESAHMPSLADARTLLPAAAELVLDPDHESTWRILSADGQTLARLVRTLPAARDHVGYRGPTEALLSLDADDRISDVDILGSHDTVKHVEAVKRSTKFLDQFRGLTWGGVDALGKPAEIDGVSGATLTSLAMAEGILARLGNAPHSLVFPNPIDRDQALALFPDLGHPNAVVEGDSIATITSLKGAVLGWVIRTGAWVDDEIGYQGPTEVLLPIDTSGRLLKPKIRQSFDNEPYVGYVPQEAYFWAAFVGKTLPELATFEPDAQGVEGVSGATMTSMAIAYVIPRVAEKIESAGGLTALTATPAKPTLATRLGSAIGKVRWTTIDVLTIGLIALLGVLHVCGMMRNKSLRRSWLVLVVVLLGGITGNLISLALIAGWSTAGVPWTLAIGLVALILVTLALPTTHRANPYCNHLCPHGAAQQLLRPGSKNGRKQALPRPVTRWLENVPGVLLVVAYLALLFQPSADLSVLEPFHAYLWRIASWGSLTFAAATLAVSAFIPMAYCRYGCPTGRLIEHVRLKATSSQITRVDLVAVTLLALAATRHLLLRIAPEIRWF